MALQVADRFHLLQHLADVLTDVFRTHAALLARIHAMRTNAPTHVLDPDDPATSPSIAAVPIAPLQPSTRAAALAAARRAQRVAHDEQVWTYHRQGWSLDAIAEPVGLSRRTVQRYLQSPTFPERQPRHGCGRSLLDPYQATLMAEWNHSCRNGWHLFRVIRLVLRPPARATAQDHQQLAQLTTQAPELAEAVALAQDFAALVRQRQPTHLEPWVVRAVRSPLPPFRRFARGLRADMAAVQATVTLPWSQGPIEGHINRLKMLKRHMYGRARLDLLA
jgi:hypothetical protein